MEEQKELNAEEEKPKSTGDNDEGSKSPTASLLDNANAAAERLEKANEEHSKIIAKQEELMARQRLGGTANAGTTGDEKKEESPAEYAKKVMEGKL